jgi:hypothetical protein
MKPLPAPEIPGSSEFERFDNAVRKILSISKEDILKEEAKWKRERARKKKRPKGSVAHK